ncbi:MULTISPECIES: CsbD family protein [Actinomycetes]|uniref:CsbD family protein n=2 Tax=Actinomycetes TaxID=1760 RepID=A0ABP6LQU3_9MICC|nr:MULTISPECIES: CsbD family protein [unclassified Nesterenkonia]MDS2173337.1 CsbD family protein [Nesterenkonia sp. CL21]OSM43136.1 hypothetical protein BCY76_010220 [Nesterenkonia sp. PF2B19]
MGLGDKFDAAKDQVSGQAKEAAGKATGDKRTEGEGKAQDLQGKVKETAENVKDTAGDLKDAAKGFTDNFKK